MRQNSSSSGMAKTSNPSIEPTAKKLRFLSSAHVKCWASQ